MGLLFDKKLSFIPHIKALKAKCLKALDVLKVLSNTNWGGDRSVLLTLYRSLVRSKLDYGSVVYGSARKSYLKCLDTIHHQGLRLGLGAFDTSPVESLYAESNEPSLYTRREKLSLQYIMKLAANPKNNCVFNPKYERYYNNTPSAINPLGLRIQKLLEQANISIKDVQPFSLPSKEPWTQNPPKVILGLHKNKKSEVDSHIFKNESLEINLHTNITSPLIPTVQSKMKRLHVLLLVQILWTVLDYLTIVLFLPLKPRLLILHFTYKRSTRKTVHHLFRFTLCFKVS